MADEIPAQRSAKPMLWTLVGLGVLLILILTPPLISVNRLQRRIAASMSASLGRTVHLDRASMHLFPVPGFTLQNLVVSEDPAFGAEPVIRANTVQVALRPSSLWRRHVEFSSIKFEEPSLNLVRNASGVWNMQSLLMHAASVNTAPTAQRRAGSAPRFPYIEATDARVNLKLGEEKEPFSLTDADFALWLSSPQIWQVRLEGHPVRTDTNISDPGKVRVEGSLGRAPTMAQVPVNLSASWDGAPLGEASKLISGDDANWRGRLNLGATVAGTLGSARLTSKIHVEELRRADFVPVQTLDLQAECSGTFDAISPVLTASECSMKTPAPPGSEDAGHIVTTTDKLDLPAKDVDGLEVEATNLSNAWLLDWVRLFSQRIPAGERPGGSLTGKFTLTPAPNGAVPMWHGEIWQGELHGDIDGALPWKSGDKSPIVHPVRVTGGASGFVLAPLTLTATGKATLLTLSGTATRSGYTLHLAGAATAQQVLALRKAVPPLGDGLAEALPRSAGSAAKPLKLDLTCSRLWGSGQTCTAKGPQPPKKSTRKHR